MTKETLNRPELVRKITRDILAFRRGWQDFEDRQPPKQRAEVIDLNVAPFEVWSVSFFDRRDVRNHAEYLLDNLKRSPFPQPEKDYLVAHLNASLAYLTELNGRRYDFSHYVHDTLRVWPREFSESEILSLKKEIVSLLERLGFGGDFTTAIIAFREANKTPNDQVINEIQRCTREYMPRLRQYVGIDADISYEIIPVEHDVPWKAWLRGEGDQIKLEINIHPQRVQWFRGDDKRIAMHEGTHVYQLACFKKSIIDREISPASGITTLHTPEQISGEGLATTLPLLEPALTPLSPDGELSFKLALLERIVLHNAHIKINLSTPGSRDERIREMDRTIKDVKYHIPYLTRREIRDILSRRLQSALDRGYELSYTEGARLHIEVLEDLGRNPALFRELVREEFRRPMTAEQIREFAEQLRIDNRAPDHLIRRDNTPGRNSGITSLASKA